MKNTRAIKVLELISSDMHDDAITLDGKPFDGRTVAQAIGRLCAAISALADIVKELHEEEQDNV